MRKRTTLAALAALFFQLAGAFTVAPVHASDLVIYDDALAANWQNWSWNTTASFANTSPVHAGTNSVSAQFTAPWAGLSLRISPALTGSDYDAVTFWAHGGSSGTRQLQFFIEQNDGGNTTPPLAFDVPANVWTPFTFTMSALGNPAAIARLDIQDRVGVAQPTFYLDDIRLVASNAPPPAPLSGTIAVQTNGATKPFDRRLLGTNLPAWLGASNFANATFRARTVASGVSVIRLPGGSYSNAYGWLSCEMRANQAGALACGNGWESWVSRPTDFLEFLRATGAQGMWVVSPNSTSKEAAAAVAFFNARITDTATIGVDIKGTNWLTAGHWAQLRAAHGNVEPLPIALWSFGNEAYGTKPAPGVTGCTPWGWEDLWTCDGGEYVAGIGSGATRHEGYLEFRAAMRAVDSTIQVGADGSPTTSEYGNWGNEVIAAAGNVMDFYDLHQYAYDTLPANPATALAQPQSRWPSVIADAHSAFATHANGRDIPIGVTEYNLISVQDNDPGQWLTRQVNALHVADTIGQMASQGVVMANQWDLANGAAGNGTEYGLMHVGNNWFRAPQYYAFPLWARFGSALLPVTTTLDAATQLSVYAGRINPTTYSLLAINKTAAPITASIALSDVSGARYVLGGVADVVAAPSPMSQNIAFNGVSDPSNDLSDAPPLQLSASDVGIAHVFAPYSVTLLRMTTSCNGARAVSHCVFVPMAMRGVVTGF